MVHSFQLSLGSITGSLYTFFYFLRKSGTFQTQTLFCKFSMKILQFTYLQWQFLANYWYSSGDLSYLSLTLSKIRRAISQNPGKMAYQRVESPTGVTTLTSAPLESKYLTISELYRLVATMMAVSPASVTVLTFASHFSTKYLTISIFPLKQALTRGVIFDLSVIAAQMSSGYFCNILEMLSYSFRQIQQSIYACFEQALLTAPILFQQLFKNEIIQSLFRGFKLFALLRFFRDYLNLALNLSQFGLAHGFSNVFDEIKVAFGLFEPGSQIVSINTFGNVDDAHEGEYSRGSLKLGLVEGLLEEISKVEVQPIDKFVLIIHQNAQVIVNHIVVLGLIQKSIVLKLLITFNQLNLADLTFTFEHSQFFRIVINLNRCLAIIYNEGRAQAGYRSYRDIVFKRYFWLPRNMVPQFLKENHLFSTLIHSYILSR